MANYAPTIISNRLSQDGTTPLYVRYNYDRTKRTLISTGYNIKPAHWDDKKKWIKRACPQFDEIDVVLKKFTSKLGEILIHARDNGIEPTVNFVLLELEKNKNYQQRSNQVDMFELLEMHMEEKKTVVTDDRIRDFKTLRKHLTIFKEYSSQPVTFRNLNLKFYNEFMDYLSYKVVQPNGTIGLVTNSAGKMINLLKAFVNHQVAKGVIPAIDLKSFKVVEEETDAIYLTENELAEIYKLNLSNDNDLEVIRDIFIVGCYTGLRYSDLSSLASEHIDFGNENINIKPGKIHRSVTIPIIDYVPEILKKYNYELPKKSMQEFNARVKELGQLINLNQRIEIVRKKGKNRVTDIFEKWELISSHTCRRSFCTNMYLSGFPSDELKKVSGHKSPAAFMRYIKIDNQQAASRLKELRAKIKN